MTCICPASRGSLLIAFNMAGRTWEQRPVAISRCAGLPFPTDCRTGFTPMRLGLVCLAVSATVVAAAWAWLGAPEPVSQAPVAAGEKLYCLSYAPLRDRQTPLDPGTIISAAQIEDDLARLAKITDCVRSYSVDYGLDQIASIAARHGLKVMQGLWLAGHHEKNRF